MNTRRKVITCIILAVLFLCFVFIQMIKNENVESNHYTIYCAPDRDTVYSEVLANLFPGYKVKMGRGQVLPYLESGGIVQAMDVQADSILSEGFAEYWYPHYVATVVIAIDRGQTNTQISGWNDIPKVGEQVAIVMDTHDRQLVSLAMAYGLDGENYKVESAVKLIRGLRKNERLITNSLDAPILICYDYQAVSLMKDGRNLEIIIPKEGTLSYVNGLLSNFRMTMPDDMDEQLVAMGLRLPDGRCNPDFYPATTEYGSSAFIPDKAYYSAESLNAEAILRRVGLGVRLYSTADAREHQLANTLLIALVLLWAASVIKRAMQKRVQKGAIIIAILLICWIILRLIKWQITFESPLARFLWYFYIPFQILISFTLLWLSWGIDKPDDKTKIPLWLRISGLICAFSILFVFTNDWHGLVYILDLAKSGWLDVYTYGIGYYIVLSIFSVQVMVAIGMLVIRCIRGPRKKGLIFPSLLLMLFAAYGYGYVNRIPIAYESDLVMVFAVLSILFFEASIRSGMIPVNTKYTQFFTHSPLSMQIIDDSGNVVISSKATNSFSNAMPSSLFASDARSMRIDKDTLLLSGKITGGYAVWYDDIGQLNRLHEQIAQSVEKLKRTNEVLARDSRIKQDIEEERARNNLMDGLEAEISDNLLELSAMAQLLPQAKDKKYETSLVALSLCFIKRRSDFFFSKQEAFPIGVSELMVCAEELGEYAALAGTDVQIVNELNGTLPAYLVDALYGFFGEALIHCAKNRFERVLARLYTENEQCSMWLMLPENNSPYLMGFRLAEDVSGYGGTFDSKDLDDAVGIRLTIPIKREDS